LRAFRQGLKDTSYVEGENVAILHRFAEYQTDRLPELTTELVRRQVTVIVTLASDALAAARAATATIPIVFIVAEDPVLWPGLSRAGGNVTGINFYSAELPTKRLELLHELVPTVPCSSIRPVPMPRPRGQTWQRLRPPSGFKSKSLMPAPVARSIRPSQLLCASGLTPSLSAPTPSSPPGVSNWPSWRRATRFPLRIRDVTTPQSAGS